MGNKEFYRVLKEALESGGEALVALEKRMSRIGHPLGAPCSPYPVAERNRLNRDAQRVINQRNGDPDD